MRCFAVLRELIATAQPGTVSRVSSFTRNHPDEVMESRAYGLQGKMGAVREHRDPRPSVRGVRR